MGTCLVSVQVTGSHHNGQPSDIDQLAAQFVDTLKGKGYTVSHAILNSGGGYDLLNTASRFPIRDQG
jgi:hypothetical protein